TSSAAEAARVIASSPSMISARRRSTGSSTTARRCRETATKTSPSSVALAATNATPKSCQAAGSYAASISGRSTSAPTSPTQYLAGRLEWLGLAGSADNLGANGGLVDYLVRLDDASPNGIRPVVGDKPGAGLMANVVSRLPSAGKEESALLVR